MFLFLNATQFWSEWVIYEHNYILLTLCYHSSINWPWFREREREQRKKKRRRNITARIITCRKIVMSTPNGKRSDKKGKSITSKKDSPKTWRNHYIKSPSRTQRTQWILRQSYLLLALTHFLLLFAHYCLLSICSYTN